MQYMPSTAFAHGLDRLYALVEEDHKPPAPDDLPASFAYAALLHVVDLAHGISLLHCDGRCSVVPPLMRSQLEYTMGTLWLADAGLDAVKVLLGSAQFTGAKLLKHMTAAGKTPGDYWSAEIADGFREGLAIPPLQHRDAYLSGFSHLLNEYGFDDLVSVYDVLSAHSHLSMYGLLRGLSFLPPGISEQIRAQVDCEQHAFLMLFDAVGAVDGLLVGSPWSAGLTHIGADYGLVPSRPQRRSRPKI